MSRILLLE